MQNNQSRKENEQGSFCIARLLSPKDVAEILGISVKTVHKLVRAGKLEHVRLTGSKKAFTPELLGEFIRGETVRRALQGDEDYERDVSASPTMDPYDYRNANFYGHSPWHYPHGWPGPRF